jgi:putative NADPH-quinone reductase
MMTRIVIIQGHPDASEPHLCHALADAYARGAEAGGHSVERIELARIGVPFLTSQKEQQQGPLSPPIHDAQVKIRRADHLVFVYPLWLGCMPALVKAFLEQVARPGFAYDTSGAVRQRPSERQVGAGGDHHGHARLVLQGRLRLP